jgi:hypothetical protein
MALIDQPGQVINPKTLNIFTLEKKIKNKQNSEFFVKKKLMIITQFLELIT